MWLISTIIILGLLSLLPLISYVHAQEEVDGLYYSIKVPNTWTYTDSAKSPINDLVGINSFSSIVLVPNEFGTYLIEEDDPIELENGSAVVMFSKDYDYSVKNAPLDLYVKYRTDKNEIMNTTSQQNTTVGGEKAVKIEGNGLDNYENVKFLDYLVLHNNEPYQIRYMANVNDYDKFLPQFEQMVKSFGFQD